MGDPGNIVELASTTQGLRAVASFSTSRTIQFAAANNGIDVTGGNTLTLSTAFGGPGYEAFTKGDNGTLAFGPAVNNYANMRRNLDDQRRRVANLQLQQPHQRVGGISSTPAVGSALQLTNNLTLPTSLTLNSSGINSAGQLENFSGNNTVTGPITLTAASVIGADAGSTLNVVGGITTTGTYGLTLNSAAGATINVNTSPISGVTSITEIGSGTVNVSSRAAPRSWHR